MTLPAALPSRDTIDAALNALFPARKIKRVLLINPPDADSSLFRMDTAKRGRYTNYPPYGLAILAQRLRDIGVECRILNLNHEVLKATHRDFFDHEAVWQAELAAWMDWFKPDFIGVTCMFTMTHESLKRVCAEI